MWKHLLCSSAVRLLPLGALAAAGLSTTALAAAGASLSSLACRAALCFATLPCTGCEKSRRNQHLLETTWRLKKILLPCLPQPAGSASTPPNCEHPAQA